MNPTLSACIMTRDSAARLPALIAQLRTVAAEIVVAVDSASTDATYEVARMYADVAFPFHANGQTAPVRELILRHASCGWILSVDDDELLETASLPVIGEVIKRPDVMSYWFARKWLVSLEPPLYAHAAPHYPDWQLRLFRNDLRIVHKPSRAHSGYFVAGPSEFDPRLVLLHYEQLLIGADARRAKLEKYRGFGGQPHTDKLFLISSDVELRPAMVPDTIPASPSKVALPSTDVVDLPAVAVPGWRAEFLSVDAPRVAAPGEQLLITVVAKNIGTLSWLPSNGRVQITLGSHLLDRQGQTLEFDWDRTAVIARVDPGTTATFFAVSRTPEVPGEYVFEWDMVCEGECWFASLGSGTVRHALLVKKPIAEKH